MSRRMFKGAILYLRKASVGEMFRARRKLERRPSMGLRIVVDAWYMALVWDSMIGRTCFELVDRRLGGVVRYSSEECLEFGACF